MRQIVRGFLWLIKGMLTLIALAALCLWPVSYGHAGWIELSRVTARPERVTAVELNVGWQDGRIGILETLQEYAGDYVSYRNTRASIHRAGWDWIVELASPRFVSENFGRSWGPFGWGSVVDEYRGASFDGHHASLPCWLLASLTGAWPLTSLVLLLRRRARTRRRARAGCCLRCGYDLRATPRSGAATGALLPHCPECGSVS
jgi:hypothetical protein